MARTKKQNEMPRLTLKRAKELAMQEFGTAKGLQPQKGLIPGFFEMCLGNLYVQIHNDVVDQSGCILVSINVDSYVLATQYYNPETLEHDFKTQDEYNRKDKQAQLKDWIGSNGVEVCHEMINRTWKEIAHET